MSMKLTELLVNQRLIIQLLWGEQKIEFNSDVVESDEAAVYVTPYLHNGSPLELNVNQENAVVCNIFTDEPVTKQRISWKNIELTTVNRNDAIMYRLKSYGFNFVSEHDDRRLNERIIIQVSGKLFDGNTEDGIDLIVHDISDVGISFFAPVSFNPQVNQFTITFVDKVDEKEFDVKVDCVFSRISNKAGNKLIGCRVVGENKDYKLYCFMKRLMDKNRIKIKEKVSNDEGIEAEALEGATVIQE